MPVQLPALRPERLGSKLKFERVQSRLKPERVQTRLRSEHIQAQLEKLPGWELAGDGRALGRVYLLPTIRAYDFRDRLSRNGTEVARYTYDAFDRRVEKLLPAGVETTAWSGWRPVETTWNGLVRSRRIYGLGLDEIAELHSDVDGDGELETRSLPWSDSRGNPALLARTDGRVVERYSYTPFGDREIRVDATRPRIELLRSRNGQIWLDVSEQVLREQFYRSLEFGQVRLEDTSQVPPVEVPMVPEEIGGVEAGLSRVAALQTGSAATNLAERSQALRLTAGSTSGPVTMSGHSVSAMAHRLQTARRLVLGLPSPPAEGTPLRLVIAAGAIEDPFLNSLAADSSQEFTWSAGDTVIADTAAPEVHAVGLREGRLEVTFSDRTSQRRRPPSTPARRSTGPSPTTATRSAARRRSRRALSPSRWRRR